MAYTNPKFITGLSCGTEVPLLRFVRMTGAGRAALCTDPDTHVPVGVLVSYANRGAGSIIAIIAGTSVEMRGGGTLSEGDRVWFDDEGRVVRAADGGKSLGVVQGDATIEDQMVVVYFDVTVTGAGGGGLTPAQAAKLAGIQAGAEVNPDHFSQFSAIDGNTAFSAPDGEIGFYDSQGNQIQDGNLTRLSYIELAKNYAVFNEDPTNLTTDLSAYSGHRSLLYDRAAHGGPLIMLLYRQGDTYVTYLTAATVVVNNDSNGNLESFTLQNITLSERHKNYGSGTGYGWNITLSETEISIADEVVDLVEYLATTALTDITLTSDDTFLLNGRKYIGVNEAFEYHDAHHTGIHTLTGYTYILGNPNTNGQVRESGNLLTIQPLNDDDKKKIKDVIIVGKRIRYQVSSTRYTEYTVASTPAELFGRLSFNFTNKLVVGAALGNNTAIGVVIESNIAARSEYATVAFTGRYSDLTGTPSGDFTEAREAKLTSQTFSKSISRTMVTTNSSATDEMNISTGEPAYQGATNKVNIDIGSDNTILSALTTKDYFDIEKVSGSGRIIAKIVASRVVPTDSQVWELWYVSALYSENVDQYGELPNGDYTIQFSARG